MEEDIKDLEAKALAYYRGKDSLVSNMTYKGTLDGVMYFSPSYNLGEDGAIGVFRLITYSTGKFSCIYDDEAFDIYDKIEANNIKELEAKALAYYRENCDVPSEIAKYVKTVDGVMCFYTESDFVSTAGITHIITYSDGKFSLITGKDVTKITSAP